MSEQYQWCAVGLDDPRDLFQASGEDAARWQDSLAAFVAHTEHKEVKKLIYSIMQKIVV